MKKLRVKIIFLGHPPLNINVKHLENWKSKLFEVIKPIGKILLAENADLDEWGFSDRNIVTMLPEKFEGDFLIAVTSVPLENNYYSRRFSNNRICITFAEIDDFLRESNIPLDNFILRALYSATLVYKRNNERIPTSTEVSNFTHDETRGCIFDMNGIKKDIVYSVNGPIICNSCIHSLISNKIEDNVIKSVSDEIKKIKKSLYYRMSDLIKEYPICALFVSFLTAILLGTIGSIIASYLWEGFIKSWIGINH